MDVGRDLNIRIGSNASEDNEILSTLKPVDRSNHYVQPCMEGTRESILGKIDRWLEDVNVPNALWITGWPGSGKSTIASSLVRRLTKRCQMGSSFNFKRGDVTLSDPAVVWRTIAHDLARYDTSFASILVKALKEGLIELDRPDIGLHFESLILNPLKECRKNPFLRRITVIVLDALDECGSDSSQEMQRRALLDTIVQWSRLPWTCKLIVTGRDERMPESFRRSCKRIDLPTGGKDVTQDIRHFFVQRFAEIGGPSLTDWPGDKVLDTLTHRAAGLFIWADTAVRFVDQGLPDEQLEHVLSGYLGEGDTVTKLYRQILQHIFREANDRMVHVFHQVVTPIVLAKVPLHVDDLPVFILQPKASVTIILRKLSSVISVDDFGIIHVNHLSFSEFICDARRCPRRFYIDRCKASHNMSMTCFRLMKDVKDGLKFNICNLETSYLPNSKVHDLPERISRNIQRPVLYSCRFWAAHVVETSTDLEENVTLITDIRDFFQSRFLCWLEVMSVTEDVEAAYTTLLSAANWIEVSELIY
jgi:hypothetical protein